MLYGKVANDWEPLHGAWKVVAVKMLAPELKIDLGLGVGLRAHWARIAESRKSSRARPTCDEQFCSL